MEAQGIDRIPQIHTGQAAIAIDERGGQSDRVEINNNIIDFNQASSKLKARKVAMSEADARIAKQEKVESAHALAIEMEVERVKATQHYLKLIRGFDKTWDLRETWLAWKPVEEVHRPEWKQIDVGIRKSISSIIASIKKLTTEYFDIYGRDVKQDAGTIGGGSMSGTDASSTPNENIELNGP